MAQKFTLNKSERLKSKKLIDQLFAEGQSLFAHPFKLVYNTEKVEDTEGQTGLLFGVVVPKKKIKSAPLRNLVKRRAREAYRLHRLPLQEKLALSNVKVSLMFIYIAQEPADYSVITKGITKLLDKLENELTLPTT